jgi:hypothetical protein
MNNIATKLTSLVCAGTLGVAYSDSEPKKPSEGSIVPVTKRLQVSEAWLLAMHGKTLSSIGDIISVQIKSKRARALNPSQPTQWSHTDVWNLIENGVMTDYFCVGVALGLPPIFTIEYSDGTKVHCDACTARITLPGGRTGIVVLIQKKPNKP